MLLRSLGTIFHRRICKSSGFNAVSRHFSSVQDNAKYPKKIFSGAQPTGAIHIGNYLGAIRQWVDMQNSGENVIYCIVDLHSITLPQDPIELKKNILGLAATFLACGIDPQKSTLFIQSDVKQHAELSWILGCLTTMPRLGHLPQYKEKSKSLKEIPLGLFVYPVLQAADVLMYKTTHVPVGEDQVQQIQLAQHLASLFNTRFGETFPHCHAVVKEDASKRIKSLRDPSKKMSKSDPNAKATILLTDSSDSLRDKVKKAITDFTSEVTFDPEGRPGVANLISIHSLLTGDSIEKICKDCQGIDTGKYKLRLADIVVDHIEPIRTKIEDFLKHPEYLTKVLRVGAEKASEVAEKTMVEVKGKVGLGG